MKQFNFSLVQFIFVVTFLAVPNNGKQLVLFNEENGETTLSPNTDSNINSIHQTETEENFHDENAVVQALNQIKTQIKSCEHQSHLIFTRKHSTEFTKLNQKLDNLNEKYAQVQEDFVRSNNNDAISSNTILDTLGQVKTEIQNDFGESLQELLVEMRRSSAEKTNDLNKRHEDFKIEVGNGFRNLGMEINHEIRSRSAVLEAITQEIDKKLVEVKAQGSEYNRDITSKLLEIEKKTNQMSTKISTNSCNNPECPNIASGTFGCSTKFRNYSNLCWKYCQGSSGKWCYTKHPNGKQCTEDNHCSITAQCHFPCSSASDPGCVDKC